MDDRSLGQRAADAVARGVGSWRFVLTQNSLIFCWMLLNMVGWFYHWDAWPFLFLNIIMSWQAANTGPILQMSANRQSQKDREQVNRIEGLVKGTEGLAERLVHIEELTDQHVREQREELLYLKQHLTTLEQLLCNNG